MTHVTLIDRKGMSLVEVMVALVILLFVSLALMQTALVSIEANMTNLLRDEAVNIAGMRMDQVRNISYAALQTDPNCDALAEGADCAALAADDDCLIRRSIRNGDYDFWTRTTVAGIGDNKQVNIDIRWCWKDKVYKHKANTIIRNPG
jgi:prepilin-type N-terminal cleavage/methylation domain-containing protein